ncbi:hypothetical protein AMECASPLE_016064 [Ameca splendens]|uniref:Uncharacterized protein n=1 Tax=Ameca splendens TaxID=208324 RepID=A0ABV0XR00_9TELE
MSLNVPAEEKHPHSMLLTPPFFSMVTGYSGCSAVLIFHFKKGFACMPEVSVLVTSEQRTFFHMFDVSQMACGKQQIRLVVAFLQKWIHSRNSFIKVRFVKCITNHCPRDAMGLLLLL